MASFVLRRLIQALTVLVIVTVLIFILVRLLPGDPILNYISMDSYNNTTQAQIDDLRKEYGLDKSLPLQYFDWMGGVLRGDLGKSIFYGTSVTEEIGTALPITLYIGLMAWVLAHIVGVAAGVLSAIRRGSGLDTTITVISNFLIAAPIFWFGVMLIYVFGLKLGWLPIDGYTSPFQDLGLSLRKAAMPVFCLTLFPLAGALRQTRSSMLEVMRQQYIRFAWAKGLSESSVILVHALKNGMIPVITLAGMGITGMFGGAVLVETVYSIPGMGRLAVQAALTQDYAVIQGVVLVITAIVVVTNLLVDISYAWLDPRVRYT